MYQKVRNISEIFTVFITQILKGKAIINKNFLWRGGKNGKQKRKRIIIIMEA